MSETTRDKLARELRVVAAKTGAPNAARYEAFAVRAETGEFDATKEESDEWARNPSGQTAAQQLSPKVRKLLGLDPLN